jgi:hypothetical protein
MKRGVRPVSGTLDMTMLDGVVMNVIDMASEIVVVDDDVFPETALPEASFTSGATHRRTILVVRHPSRKTGFYLRPSVDVVVITGRKSPNDMHMVRHYNDCEHFKGASSVRRTKRCSKIVDTLRQQSAAPFEQVDGEEKGAARHTCTSIIGHPRKMACDNVRFYRSNTL